MSYISLSVDIDNILDQLSVDDIVIWVKKYADESDKRAVIEALCGTSDTKLVNLCNELTDYGVHSFLNAFAYEMNKLCPNESVMVRNKIDEYFRSLK